MSEKEKPKILIVDDVPANIIAMKKILKKVDAEIFEATNGNDALTLTIQHNFALVLLDVQMPNMDGYEVAENMRSVEQTKYTPIIFVTAKMMDKNNIKDGYSAGAVDYILKPIDKNALLSKVQVFIDLYDQKSNIDHQRLEAEEASRQKSEFLANMQETNEQQLAYLAHHDPLTDLPNRTLFNERMDEALQKVEQGKRFAVLLLDLDRFKQVNDTLGHLVGDELLKVVAKRLRSCVRENDTIARLGGDEFAIIQYLSSKPPEGAAVLAQRICEVLKTPFNLKGHQVVAGTSIGIAVAPDNGKDIDQLLKNADLALYQAKKEGSNAFQYFEPEMAAQIRERKRLELDLSKALELEEFELYYQPLITLDNTEVTGVEALIRWNHPERGLVPPIDFIPIAEEMGLIIPLGEWVIRNACMQAANWPADISVAVNLSPAQFRSDDLEQTVFSAIANAGIPATRLVLEITEGVLLQDKGLIIQTLQNLQKFGVCIAIDDFGIGYSSFNYLKSFTFDKIKVDRSFVREMENDAVNSAVVNIVADMGHNLSLITTAEGVETEEQLDFIKKLGYSEAQGFLFSPPKTAKEISKMLADSSEKIKFKA